MKNQPSVEQLAAVRRFAASQGHTWKQALRDAWMRGYYPVGTQGDDSGYLQQLRNTLGPSWLKTFKLESEA